MTIPSISTIPYVEEQKVTYDLPNGAPDITASSETLAPIRITIRYSQHPSYAIPHVIEVTIKGIVRSDDGTLSRHTNTREVWRYTPAEDRPAWIATLVTDNLPTWWTA